MSDASAHACNIETVADLNTLHSLNAHHSLRQQCVELAIPVHVAAETHRHAIGQHLDNAAERVAIFCRRFDLFDHCVFGRLIETTNRRLIDRTEVGHRW